MDILESPELLERCSHDECYGLESVTPIAVIQPKSNLEVKEAVSYARENNLYLVPRGTGTGKAGGCTPINSNSLVIDFSKFNKIVEISPEDLTARVHPGVILADLRAELDKLNLFYPPDPSSWRWCTVGGTVATNAAGPSSLKYGCTRDYVLGLEIVTASGEILKIGKNTVKGVAGFDMASLVCGSEGTLALITEITLKVLPKPKAIQTALLEFASNTDAISSINKILSLGYLPKTLEYMDEACMQGKPAVILEFDGDNSDSLLESLSDCVQALEPLGLLSSKVALSEKQRSEIWDKRYLMSRVLKSRFKHKLSEDIAVPRSKMLSFIEKLKKLGEKYEVETASFGHAGDGNLHAQVLFNQELSQKKIDQILGEICAVSIELNGTITGEHGIGIAKKAYLPMEQSQSVIFLQKLIKKAFDPEGILNPGKIF